MFQIKSHFILLLIFGLLAGLQPATAESRERKKRSLDSQLLVQNQIRVTDIQLNNTEGGLQLIIETADGQKLVPLILPEGNNLAIALTDAELDLATGSSFQQANPAPGITEITAVQQNNDIQIVIKGERNTPSAEVLSSRENLVLSITPEASTAKEADEEIEVIATGQGEDDDYIVEDVTSATRINTTILDSSQSIQVIPQQVLEDQQVIRLDEALRNVSGVTFGGTNLGRSLEFSIRGFDEAPIIRNGFRQFGGDIIPETANLERVEVLKGPSSILFGEIEPGGLINLVTKKPTGETFYRVETQFGNRSLISPSIDFSAPLTKDGDVSYRFNALYRSSDDIQDVDENIERFFISPVVTWKIGENTDLNLELEYLNEDRPPSFGIPAIGDEIADIPFDQITNEPDDSGEEEFLSVGYDLEHRFSKNWKLRNAFRFTEQSASIEIAFPFEIDEETGTVFRFFGSQPQDGESYSLQTTTEGKFATGKINHQILAGLDLNLAEDNFNEQTRLDLETPLELDLFNPIYGQSPRPDEDTLPFIEDRERETRRLGLFAQDRIAFGDKFFLLAGLRYDTVKQIITDNLESTEIDDTNSNITPRVGVVYKPIEPVSLYTSYSQSFAPNTEDTNSEGEPLEPEEGEGFEVGVKSEFLNGKLFTTLAYFNIDKENVASADPDDPFSSVATGKQSSQGIELDIAGEITPGWNIIASYAYIDGEVSEDNNDEIVGNRLNNSPENSASLWTTYQLQQGNLEGLGFGLGFNFVGEREGDLDNSFTLDSYFLTNAALFYDRNKYRVGLNFKNLFDVDYIAGASEPRERGNDRGEPFTVIGSFSYEF